MTDHSGTAWGLRVLAEESDLLAIALASSRRGARHHLMLSGVGKVIGPVKAGHLNERHAATGLETIVRTTAPGRLSEFHSAWKWCLLNTKPRGPRHDDRTADRFLDRTDRQALAAAWLDSGPCRDPLVTGGGTKGANALAIAVHFAVTSVRAGSTLLSESHAQIGEHVCMDAATVWRCGQLWRRHVNLVSKGHRSRENARCKAAEPCKWCATSPDLRPGDPVASLWRLRESVPYVQQPEGQRYDPCGDIAHQGQIHVPLGEDIALPWADRWVKRKGGRQEWRLWLALADDDAMTHGQLVKATGLGKNQVSEYLSLMANAEEIAQTDPGRWVRLHGPSWYDDLSTRQHSGCRRCRPLSVRAAA